MNGLKVQVYGQVLFTLLVASVYGGNILVFPVDGSHWVNMEVLIETLHANGHNVMVIRAIDSWYIKETSPFYTTITVQSKGSFDKNFMGNTVSRLLEIRRAGSIWTRLKHDKEMWDTKAEMMENDRQKVLSMIKDHELMQSLKASKYDVCITDPALMVGVIMCHYLKLPLVFNVRWTVHGEGHFAIAPSPLSYVPIPLLEFSDHMNFFQRVQNVLMYLVIQLQIQYFMASPNNALSKEVFGPEVNYFEIVQGADLWLYRVDFTFEFPRPTMPNVVYMGGFQCKPSKPLPEDLEDFVQSSGEHGVIVMSLGTIVGHLPHDVTNAIAEAFSELPQKVIWMYKGERPSTVGNNTLLLDWIPQNDLLGHPKTRVFVAHGGTNGLHEAIYHGVPIVGIGLIWDQPDNLSKMQVKGVAKNVDFPTMTKDSFLEAVKEVLNEPSYREKMQKLSKIHKDVPIKPLDNAVFWIEHTMRHGGAAHLRSESYKMPWYTYHSVDVLVSLMTVVLLFVFITYAIIKHVCCRMCLRKKCTRNDCS